MILFASCDKCEKHQSLKELKLSSWQDIELKDNNFVSIHSIIAYVDSVTCKRSSEYIPKEDRIAVFDMDGTIACEKPVSMETFCTYKVAYPDDSITSVKNDTIYTARGRSFTADSFTKALKTKLKNNPIYSDSLVASYISILNRITNNNIPEKKPDTIDIKDQFYKPMVELINYLQNNKFQVYIVSGSLQQFIWAAIENVDELKIDRSHIIGSLVSYDTVHYYTKGAGNKFYFDDKYRITNTCRNKAVNIYNKIGKFPVFAFGNTVNDFDIFAFTASNNKSYKDSQEFKQNKLKHKNNTLEYKTMCILLNHDDSTLEANYDPFHKDSAVTKNWNDTTYKDSIWAQEIFDTIMHRHGWKIANISECFKENSVFIDIK